MSNNKDSRKSSNYKKAWTRQLSVLPWEPDPAQRKINNPYLPWLKAQPWSFFCAGTTRYELTLKSARRLAERFYKAILNQAPSVNMFWAAEPFDVKEGHHIHFLVYFDKSPTPGLFKTLIDLWQWCTGNKALFIYAGTNKIEWEKDSWNAINLRDYDSKRGAAGYTAKYMNKTRADYDYINSYDQLRSSSEITDQDYCPARERKRRDSVYHIGRALQECNSAQG